MSTAPMDPSANLRAVGISTSLQRTLVGGPLTLPVPNLDTFGLAGNAATVGARTITFRDMYNSTAEPLHGIGLNTLDTIDLLNTINFGTYVPDGGAVYPAGSFGYAMKTTAALIKAQVGVEAIAMDMGGYDTHANQGSTTGDMHNLMTTLAGAMAAFHTDMTTGIAPTFTMVVMSEFGRRFNENGSFGSDHGHGNVMLVMGNCITGGRVMAEWPGCNNNQLYQGLDLQVTTDYRDVLAEICANRLGNTNLPDLFPNYTPTFRGVTGPC
jgi:uncharacterized protein (DUF1501 family)